MSAIVWLKSASRLLTSLTAWFRQLRDCLFRPSQRVEPAVLVTRAERRRRMRTQARVIATELKATRQPRYQRRRIAWEKAKREAV